MITLTEQNVRATMTKGLGLNKAQARLYGLNYPLRKGWLQRLIGKEIDPKIYKAIMSLKGHTKQKEK